MASRSIIASGTVTLERTDHVNAFSTIETGTAETLVDFGLTISAIKTRTAPALIAVDAINTLSVQTGVGIAFIDVVFAVRSPCSFLTPALISIGEIFALSLVLARAAVALVNFPVAQEAGVSGVTVTPEGVVTVDTMAILARIVVAVVTVDFTPISIESRKTITGKRSKRVSARSAIQARIVQTFIHICLAVFACKSIGTSAAITVDEISTNTII